MQDHLIQHGLLKDYQNNKIAMHLGSLPEIKVEQIDHAQGRVTFSQKPTGSVHANFRHE